MRGKIMNDKDDVINRLYALRAGLSVISVERDKADKLVVDENNKNKQLLTAAQQKINKAESKVTQSKAALKSINDEIKGNQYFIDRNIDNNKRLGYKILLGLICFVALIFIVAFLLTLWFVIANWFFDGVTESSGFQALYGWYNRYGEGLRLLFSWLILPELIAFGFIVVVLWVLGSKVHDEIKGINFDEKAKSDARLDKLTLTDKKKRAEQTLRDAENNVSLCEENFDDVQSEAEENLELAIDDAQIYLKRGEIISTMLNNIYGDLLDMRDWCNLDIVLFSLETGRADSIKEALLIADKERQTERIVEAIEFAGKEICQTIETNFNKLQNNMVKCFSILSEQMSLQTQTIIKQIGGMKAQMVSLNDNINNSAEYLSEITSAINMNNALLAKSNVTSATLAEDVKIVRNYSDNEEIRRRNGIE
jgi:hypothetical protein